jgi:hypothetical protein
MSNNRNFREDYAVIAHVDERILLVKMAGYTDLPWRFPQGVIRQNEVPADGVRRVLDDIVGCSETEYIRNTRIVKEVSYSKGDRAASDPAVTGVIFPGKILHFYVAKLLCLESDLKKGSRVQAIMFENQGNLAAYLSGAELDAFRQFAPGYTFSDEDMDRKIDGIIARLRAENKGYDGGRNKRRK